MKILVSAFVLSSALVGCGSGSDEAPVTVGPAAASSTAPPEAQAVQQASAPSATESQQRAAAASQGR